MTTGAMRIVAELVAKRLGGEATELEAALGDDPIAAAIALSMAGQDRSGARGDPAGVVRYVASIVGGCPICLGVDNTCGECEGKGAPGSRSPDREALLEWLDRPLRRLGLCVGKLRPGAR